jgi:hypothetical protein
MNAALKTGSYAAIGVLLVAAVVTQILLGRAAYRAATLGTETTRFAVPYAIAAVIAIAGIEVMLVALARVVSLATNGRAIERASVAWVTTIAWALAVSTATVAVVMLRHMLFWLPSFNAFGLALLALTAGGIVATLLTVVLRAVLSEAIGDREELAVVV